jgi:hypothetical protein
MSGVDQPAGGAPGAIDLPIPLLPQQGAAGWCLRVQCRGSRGIDRDLDEVGHRGRVRDSNRVGGVDLLDSPRAGTLRHEALCVGVDHQVARADHGPRWQRLPGRNLRTLVEHGCE